MSIDSALSELMANLDVRFKNPDLLQRAVTHSSYSNEHPESVDNERLEFLGDAILGAIVSHMLWAKYPNCHEGVLTRYKAVLVQEQGLLPIADALELGRFLRLGKGEELTGGREKPSVLSDAVEALVASVYIDQGFEAVSRMVNGWYEDRILRVHDSEQSADFKTKLQELTQSREKRAPTYEITAIDGPSHSRIYTAMVRLDGINLGSGEGRSKKSAEQAAARVAFEGLLNHDKDVTPG
ncbi:MAG: ribonuclease III [Myxococcota bacterium]|nr:ribonuclease III [Myxococcota bacterium]